jgi:hypothetical protein
MDMKMDTDMDTGTYTWTNNDMYFMYFCDICHAYFDGQLSGHKTLTDNLKSYFTLIKTGKSIKILKNKNEHLSTELGLGH